MATIEYVSGSEQHTSNWGKFYVKGLEKIVVKEDHAANIRGKHAQYQCYVGVDVPVGTVFTVFYQAGNKRGTEAWSYFICVVEDGDGEPNTITAGYGEGVITGPFRVVVRATTATKAPRLMTWWDARPAGADPLRYAEHCAAHIDRRGVATLPPME